MEKFNNTTLFTGYLKQLLHNFNLPKYKIYTKAQKEYAQKFNKEREDVFETIVADGTEYPDSLHYIPYIRNGKIEDYIDGKWVAANSDIKNEIFRIQYYSEGMKILNQTKNLKINGNSYDPYTHEYLGDYLRFLRDYNDINLMPLYNCFSNRSCERLNYKWEELDQVPVNETDFEIKTTIRAFDTTDTAYKIYMLPIKLFQEYTIAIDSTLPIEICCGMYGAYQDEREKFIMLPKLTYQRISNSQFSAPFVYSKLALSPAAIDPNIELSTEEESKTEYALKTLSTDLIREISQNENCLKMFIKIPAINNSTIVILEGNYIGWNDRIVRILGREAGLEGNKKILETKLSASTNKTILNFEKLPDSLPFNLITPLQLLSFNTKEQHPFADRLIEYLIGNTITSADEINKNITRVQKVLVNKTQYNTKSTDYLGNIVNPYYYYYQNKGFWDNYIKYNIYDYINTHNNTFDVNHDILGYVDKDAEKYYYYHDKKTDTDISIASVEIDEEERW